MPLVLDLEDVKTVQDARKYYADKCAEEWFTTCGLTYIAGCIAIPLIWGRLFHKRFSPIVPIEYRVCATACSMMVVSFFAGRSQKLKCEKRVREEIKKMAGIEQF